LEVEVSFVCYSDSFLGYLLEVVISCLHQRFYKITIYLIDIYSYTIEKVPKLKYRTIVSIEVFINIVSEVVVKYLL
jgi:hypothetical protein